MRTFFATPRPGRRRWQRLNPPSIGRVGDRMRAVPTRLVLQGTCARRCAGEAGLTLIEVLVASLLVAVIAIGTFSAFSAASHSTADTRAHAQAIQLAGQDEERVRSLSTSTLGEFSSETAYRAENGDCLEKVSSAWHYWSATNTSFCEKATGLAGTTYSGIVFTVATTAKYVAAEKGGTNTSFTCETTTGAASYLQTTSSVTWPSLGTRPAVTQSSILALPSSSALVVKVFNQKNEAVQGATVTVGGISPERTETTPASGCAVFGALSPGAVTVTATKAGWINGESETAPTAKSVTITTNATAEEKFVIAEPGAISVEFVEAASPHGAVKGSTFYAFNTDITSTPNGFVGGTYSGVVTKPSALTTAKFTENFLFPWRKITETPTGTAPYTVFAGDCEANNPKTVTGSATDATAQVEPDATTGPVKVEMPKVTVNVYEGTTGTTSPLPSALHAMVINKACSTEKGRILNGSASVPYEHEVEISAGHLVQAYQPYAAKLELCIVQKKSSTEFYKYKGEFANTSAAGVTVPEIHMAATGTGHEKKTKESEATCP